jgi:hypothetical protein
MKRSSSVSHSQWERNSSNKLEELLLRKYSPQKTSKAKNAYKLDPRDMIITSLVQKLADNKKFLKLKFEKISKDEYKDASLSLGAIQAPKIKAENKKFIKEAEVIFKRFRAIEHKKAETEVL